LVALAVDILGTPISLLYDIFDKLGPKLEQARTRTAEELRDFSQTFGSTKSDDDEGQRPPEAAGD